MARWCCFLLLLVPLSGRAQCWLYQKSGVGAALHGVAVLDSVRRVAVGDNGTILRTTDGGSTWVRLTTGTANNIAGLSFASPTHGLAVGTSGTIFRTTDAGATWSRKLNATLAWLTAVAFPDTLHAYAIGDWIHTAILRSTDGGKSWVQDDVIWIDEMKAIAFADSDNGILAGDARLASTTNGGLSWDIIRDGDAFLGLTMPSIENGTMVGAGKIFTTTDGLLTLQSDPAGNDYALDGVCYLGKDTGYVVGHGFSGGEWGGIVLHTSTGGASWDTTFIPGTYLRAVHQTSDGQVSAVGDNGAIVSLSSNCTRPEAPTLVSPPDGATDVPLLTSLAARGVATLRWNYPAFVALAGSQIQVATDSTFGTGLSHDTLVALGASRIQLDLSAAGLEGAATYYWRVRMSFRDGTYSEWSAPSRFTTAAGIVRGLVYSDLDGDGVFDAGDLPLGSWKVDVGGTVQTSVLTDAQGIFVLRGLVSGSYVVTSVAPSRWVHTTVPDTSFVVLGPADSVDVPPQGFHYLKNSASGVVFNDRNESGVRDAGEEGLAGWSLRIEGTSNDSSVTDGNGSYFFDDLNPGTSTVTLVPRPGWEQLAPVLGIGYALTFSGYGTPHDSVDFSAHEIPPRVKNRLWVADSTRVNGRYVWWGVRPSTVDGIWGVDPLATNSDFAEGEFDLPPPTFGVFDARFVQPPASDAPYGNGSWTDMQSYTSAGQIDTFRIAFQPGYLFTGGYPMFLQWNRADMVTGFDGEVMLVGDSAGPVDMKTRDSLTVTEPSVGSLLIITNAPKIPTVGVAEGGEVPSHFALEQNYPNPFNPSTVIAYRVAATSHVSLQLYDLLGRRVATLVNELQTAGTRQVRWNATDNAGRSVPAGLYFCTMRATPVERGRAPYTETRKLLYIK
jgi:hypothetical protein